MDIIKLDTQNVNKRKKIVRLEHKVLEMRAEVAELKEDKSRLIRSKVTLKNKVQSRDEKIEAQESRIGELTKPWSAKYFDLLKAKHEEELKKQRAECDHEKSKLSDYWLKDLDKIDSLQDDAKKMQQQKLDLMRENTELKEQKERLMVQEEKTSDSKTKLKEKLYGCFEISEKLKSAYVLHTKRNMGIGPEAFDCLQCRELDKELQKLFH